MLGCCSRGTGIVHFAHKDGGHFALDSLAEAISVNVDAIPMILNSAVGARQSSGKLLMLNQCLCLKSSTMANPFGEAL